MFTFLNGKIEPLNSQVKDDFATELIKSEFKKNKRKPSVLTSELVKRYGFEWDSLSSKGYLTFKPYAAFMIEAVKLRLWRQVQDFCFENQIPLQRISGGDLYSLDNDLVSKHVALAEEVGMYGDGLLFVSEKQILRFSGCSNKLAQLKRIAIDSKKLPFGIFELSNSYRYEKEDELECLSRNRKFHLPELHIINETLYDGLTILLKGHKYIEKCMKANDLEYIMLFTTTKKFVENNDWFIKEMCSGCVHPPVINIIEGDTCENGIVFDVEYKARMQSGMLLEIATLQIDEGNTDFSYGIQYKNSPVITIHAVLFASSVERTIYTYLDKASSNYCNTLPFWLAPVQCRIIEDDNDLGKRGEIIKALSGKCRFEIDDREMSLQEKIDDSIDMRIPYIFKGSVPLLLYDRNNKSYEQAALNDLLTDTYVETSILGQFSPILMSQRIIE